MNFDWYANRLKKMSLAEILKRIFEHGNNIYGMIRYRNPEKWPYERFAGEKTELRFIQMPVEFSEIFGPFFQIYGKRFDLSKPIDWYFSEKNRKKWPKSHFITINYRPDNPFGDVRINWELNRLQFLPHMALRDEKRAKEILSDWLIKNPFLHGPAYIASMEVALRWISIYRAVCLMKEPLDKKLNKQVTGLAVASGSCILRRLSTHSSAGNHLIVESVGLFWLGKALGDSQNGIRWRRISRKILWEQIPAQIHPDGSPKEQSFWYLGFVLDAVMHYLMLEDKEKVPFTFLKRIEAALDFIDEMLPSNGLFPDFGDRDDGYVFREDGNYTKSIFNRLLSTGGCYFKQPNWIRDQHNAARWIAFYGGEKGTCQELKDQSRLSIGKKKPSMKTYQNGGMTLMQRGAGRLLFRHSHLGLGNTCGHGHADALSVIFYWKHKPVLVDIGSGQYNGSQKIRNYFRSTIAHNTVEIGGKSQAEMVGPFLWRKPYQTSVTNRCHVHEFYVEAEHDGYLNNFSLIHRRKIDWYKDNQILMTDSFHGGGQNRMRGAFHLGPCKEVQIQGSKARADFEDFIFCMQFPDKFALKLEYGSKQPFFGWNSKVYGEWSPIYTIIFTNNVKSNQSYEIELKVESGL